MKVTVQEPCFGLTTGAIFDATDKLGTTHRYIFQGIALNRLSDGVGCDYIILKNADAEADFIGVEAAWFAERKITLVREPREPILPRRCVGYTVIESAKIGESEIVICKTVDGNMECDAPYVVWDAEHIGDLDYGRKMLSLEHAQLYLHNTAAVVAKNLL